MEDELVSFEVAKLAKEKWFNWKVLNHYRDDSLINNGVLFNFNSSGEQAMWNVELTSAPTQSLLQRWLREVHNIILIIDHSRELNSDNSGRNGNITENKNSLSRNLSFEYIIFINGKFESKGFSGEGYTYEKALEEGLKESLKLIK